MRHEARRQAAEEGGFALILAILALMLLTFLGLTLATTTSTELQVATNYRWSQQALYNAEAGIEVGKALLRNMNWSIILPAPRTGAGAGCTNISSGQPTEGTAAGYKCWLDTSPASAPVAPYGRPDKDGNATRNFENGGCDGRGGQIGYGVVLDDGGGEAPYQNVTRIFSQDVNGTFTLWVRRELALNQDGSFSDMGLFQGVPDNSLVLTSEGTAPYTRPNVDATLAGANRAVRFLEVTVSRTTTTPCGTRGGQIGGGPEGSNFSPCDPITGDSLAGALGRSPGSISENTNVQ